jgi:hypothetical protein
MPTYGQVSLDPGQQCHPTQPLQSRDLSQREGHVANLD